MKAKNLLLAVLSLLPLTLSASDLFLSCEALYLQAHEDGRAYGTILRSNPTPTGAETDIEVFNPHDKSHLGLRLGVGYDFCSTWALRGYWTGFRTKAHGHIEENTFSTGSTPFTPQLRVSMVYGNNFGPGGIVGGPIPNRIDSKWRLHVDIADVELGKHFEVCNCFDFRPHIGLRAVWLDQKYRIQAGAAQLIDEMPAENTITEHLKNSFEGIGLRAGFDLQWDLGYCFSLYGKSAFSIVYGSSKRTILEEDFTFFVFDESIFTDDSFFEQKDHVHISQYIVDSALGIQYQRLFCCETIKMTLLFGWEQHLFINCNHFEDFANGIRYIPDLATSGNVVNAKDPRRSRGDLCLRGWTFGLQLEY